MREIKFRAWDKEFKRFSENALKHPIEDINYLTDYKWSQYTGLKDKNGKEIYEGDIIKSDNSIGKIIYNDCEFRINWVVDKNFFNDVIPRHNKWCEVIGNIYENPNLIPDSVEVF